MEIVIGGIYKMKEEWKERVGELCGRRVALVVEKQGSYIAVAVVGVTHGKSKKIITFSYFYKLRKYYGSIDCSRLYEDVPEEIFDDKIAQVDLEVIKLILNIYNGVYSDEVEYAMHKENQGRLRILTKRLDNMSLLLRQAEQEPLDINEVSGLTQEIQQTLNEIQDTVNGVENIVTETKIDTDITRRIVVKNNKKMVIFMSNITSFILGKIFDDILVFLKIQDGEFISVIYNYIKFFFNK